MPTIKGQNLRILLGGKCVAASTDSSVHLAMQVQNRSTKDDTGDWAENVPVGMSWDARVTAYVNPKEETVTVEDIGQMEVVPGSSGTPLPGYYPVPVRLAPGDSISAIGSGSAAKIYDGDFQVLASASASASSVTYTAVNEVDVYFGAAYAPVTGLPIGQFTVTRNGGMELEDFLDAVRDKTEFDILFANTYGSMNREYDDETHEDIFCQGSAIVTDVSCSAANRQLSVYELTLTGTGELEAVEPVDGD